MKKLFTLLAAASCTIAGWAAFQVPYSSPVADAATKGPDTGWTVIDIDGDGENSVEKAKGKWSFIPGTNTYVQKMQEPCAMGYYYHSSNPGNDWLVSPAIHLEAGKTYKLRYKMCAHGSSENMKVMMAAGNSADELAAGTLIENFEPISPGDTSIKKAHVITVDADGDYYFGYYAFSIKNKWGMVVAAFSVTEDVFTPAAVSALNITTGTPSDPRAVSVTLNWTNPTTDIDGMPFADGVAVQNIIIKRDGDTVATLDGSATSWTDTAESGLTPGVHTYSVVAVAGGAESTPASIASEQVGPPPAVALPFKSNFADWTTSEAQKKVFYQNWTNVKGAASTISTIWEINKPSLTPARLTFRVYSSDITQKNPDNNNIITEDAWIVTPPITFTEAGDYIVEINAAVSQLKDKNGVEQKLRICYGTEASPEQMTQVIADAVPLTATSSRPEDSNFFSMTVSQPGDYYIGVQAAAENIIYGNSYYIYDLNVEKYAIRPAAVTDFTATPDADGALGVTLQWTNPTVDITGQTLAEPYKIQILRGEESIAEFTNVPGGEQTASFHDAPAQAGAYKYTIRSCAADGSFAEKAVVTITSPWIGPDNVDIPYSVDFTNADDTSIPLWQIVDADADTRTWELTSAGFKLNQAAAEYDDWDNTMYVDNDDFLVSPRLTLTPGEYTLKCRAKGDDQYFQIGLIADDKDVTVLSQYLKTKKCSGTINSGKDFDLTVEVTEPGDYRYVIFVKNEYNESVSAYYYLTLLSASVEKKMVIPGLATDLAVAPAAAPELSATVSWTNPALTADGAELQAIEKAIVYRNGESIATVTDGLTPGQPASYLDNTIPAAGKYTYKVEVFTVDGKSALDAPEVLSAWIGGGLDLPYSDTEFADWTILNVNGDYRVIPDPEYGDYREERTWHPGYNGLTIESNVAGGTTDDWAISPRLNLEEGETYLIEISSCVGYGNSTPYLFDVAIGTDDTPEAMTTLATVSCNAQLKKDAQTDVITVKAVAPDAPETMADNEPEVQPINVPAGVVCIGIHANKNGAVTITKVEASKKEDIVDGIDDLTADGAIRILGDVVILPAGMRDIRVCDLQGRVIISIDRPAQSVEIGSLAKGTYILSATGADGNRASLKFIR